MKYERFYCETQIDNPLVLTSKPEEDTLQHVCFAILNIQPCNDGLIKLIKRQKPTIHAQRRFL